MNSYELIETYPSSPKLGTIVVDTNINNGAKDGYFSENWGKPNGGSAFKISIQHDCENNPKFWRKIENKKLLTKDTVKEGQKVYRIWRNGDKTLGLINNNSYKNSLSFEPLEGYPKEGGVTEGLLYGLGDFYYELVEEVVEKDYEILSLARICSIKPTITDVSDYGDEFIKALLKCDNTIIHSIKRNDGQVFTVGDEIIYNEIFPTKLKIKSIQLFNGEILIHKDCTMNTNKLSEIQHCKKPIFKTFDGVDIFEGDRVYSVTPSFCIGYSGSLKYKPIQPCFLTKEKAEEYIFYNSPVLSLKEVGEIYLTAKEKGSKAYTLVRQKLNL